MVVKANGVLRGKHVELELPVTALPEGTRVSLELRPVELSLDEKRKLVNELAGSWAEDPSIGPIFEAIERERHASAGRQVSLDDPS